MAPPSPSSSVTRAIYLGTLAALAVVATLSVVIYRSAVRDTVAQHSTQQMAMVRTAAAGVQGEVQGLSARLKQFTSLPSVQNLDVAFLGPRVAAAFADNPNAVVRYVIRIDRAGKQYDWTPDGDLQQGITSAIRDAERWKWLEDAANRGHVIFTPPWWMRDPPEHLRSLMTPVWRTASSDVYPVPPNDFNGVLALMIDVNRLAELYLGPALADLAADDLVVGLGFGRQGILLGPGAAGTRSSSNDVHDHQEQGTSILDEPAGRRSRVVRRRRATNLIVASLRHTRVAAGIQRRRWGAGTTATRSSRCRSLLAAGPPRMGFKEEQRRLERQLAIADGGDRSWPAAWPMTSTTCYRHPRLRQRSTRMRPRARRSASTPGRSAVPRKAPHRSRRSCSRSAGGRCCSPTSSTSRRCSTTCSC